MLELLKSGVGRLDAEGIRVQDLRQLLVHFVELKPLSGYSMAVHLSDGRFKHAVWQKLLEVDMGLVLLAARLLFFFRDFGQTVHAFKQIVTALEHLERADLLL